MLVARRHWPFVVVAGCATALALVLLADHTASVDLPGQREWYLQYAQLFVNGQWAPDWLRTSGYCCR